jgi:hypothetical protein
MEYKLMDTHCADDGEPSTAPESISTEQSSPVSLPSSPMYNEMSAQVLAAQCLKELSNYRRGEPCTDAYGLELLRRAMVLGNQAAWEGVQHCFGEIVRDWLHGHPRREAACRLENEEHYVAQVFKRFWRATASNQRVEFKTLAAALQYLRASLNGAILETLRAYTWPSEVPLPEPAEPVKAQVEDDSTDNREVWDILQTILPNEREQRLAYLLFHCGLGPREIVRFYPQEWNDVQEIYRLRRIIMEGLLRNADPWPWRLH